MFATLDKYSLLLNKQFSANNCFEQPPQNASEFAKSRRQVDNATIDGLQQITILQCTIAGGRTKGVN